MEKLTLAFRLLLLSIGTGSELQRPDRDAARGQSSTNFLQIAP